MFLNRSKASQVSIPCHSIASILCTLGLVFVSGHDKALATTFKYKTAITETLYTEGETTRDGITYDGTFINSEFDPFAMMFRQFSGLFSITDGSLGKAVAVATVQTSPIDRTSLGEEGIARIEYFADSQDVALVPGAVSFPPNLSEFDFKFIPASVAGSPTVLTQGWSVEKVNEPHVIAALGFLGAGLLMMKKRCTPSNDMPS